MMTYKLERHGRLLMARAFVKGRRGHAYPKLLIDTGSAYTILSQEMLEYIGASPATAGKRQRIITGSGYEIVPVVTVEGFSCFEKALKGFHVIGHTLPPGVFVNGLLGMDFLSLFDFEIRTKEGKMVVK